MDHARLRPTATEVAVTAASFVRRLPWETHPLLGRQVCAMEHGGEIVYLDEAEALDAAVELIDAFVRTWDSPLEGLRAVCLDPAIRRQLAERAISSTPERWSLA